jgi:hypothetical protein
VTGKSITNNSISDEISVISNRPCAYAVDFAATVPFRKGSIDMPKVSQPVKDWEAASTPVSRVMINSQIEFGEKLLLDKTAG